MKKIFISALICVSTAIFFTGCNKKEDANSLVSTKNLAKNIELTAIDGKKLNMTYTGNGFKFAELQGKATLVVFFATWCPPCRAEVPHLVALQEKYKNDFAVVSILVEEGKRNEDVANFINEYKINYFVSNSPSNFEATEAFGGIKGIPAMFMFDKNGKQTAHYAGATPQELIEQDILKTLGK